MKWIGQHIFDFIARFRNTVYISENLTIGSDADIEPKINILNDENSVEIGIANATNDMVTGSADGDLVINSVGDHKIILAQNDAEVITIEDNTNVSFANDVFLNGDMLGASSGASTGSRLRLTEGTDNGTNTLTLNAPAAITTSTDLVLPDGFGSNGQVLTTDGNNPAALSWTTASGGADGWHGSTTRIKILASDFIPDDGGRPAFIDDTGSGSENFFLESFSSNVLYATVAIPTGFTATVVMVYGSATDAIEVWEMQINSKTGVSKGTGNVDTEIDITDVASSTTNYLLIQVANASGNEVHGGYVTITAS